MKKKDYVLLIAIFFLVVIVVLNFNMPLYGEDFALSTTLLQHNYGFLEKIQLSLQKIIFQSTNWNARLGEQLAIFFLAFNKNLFNVCNIFITLLFVYLIMIYATGKFLPINTKSLLYWSVTISLLLFLPLIGDTLLWVSVSTNYLWSLTILASFFLPYRFFYSGQDILANKPKPIYFLFFFLGLLAGMTNENTVVSIILIIIFGGVFYKKLFPQTISIPKWYWSSFSALLIGYAYLLFSPSTKIRQSYYQEVFHINNLSFSQYVEKAVHLSVQYAQSTKVLLGILVVVILFALICFRSLNFKNIFHNKNIIINFSILLFSFLSVAALIMAPYFESRSLFFNWFCLLICIINIIDQLINYNLVRILIIIPLIIIGITNSISLYHCTMSLEAESNFRHYDILSQIERGENIITVKKYRATCPVIFSDREDWRIQFQHDENYYGVDQIIIK
jgi:hypothetical protein